VHGSEEFDPNFATQNARFQNAMAQQQQMMNNQRHVANANI